MVIVGMLVLSAFAATPGVLTIWTSEAQAQILTQLGNQFQSIYGVPVKVVQMNFGDIRSKFVTAASAGEGPDIIVGANDWIGEFVADGLLAPVAFLSKEAENEFVPVALQGFSYGGKLYGLPYAVEALALIYNKDYVSEPPKTADDLFKMAQEMTSGGFYGFAYNAVSDPYFSAPFIFGFGGYVFGMGKDGTLNPKDVGLDTPGAIKGAEYIRSYFKAGLMPQGIDYNGAMNLFKEGKSAMMINGPWSVPDIQKAGIDFGVAQIPNGKPFVGVQGFMISSKSPNQIQAMEFLANYINTKDVMFKIWQKDPRVPARYDVQKEAANTGAKWVNGFSESVKNGTPMPNIPQMASVWNAWGNALNLITSLKQSPADALKTAVAQIEQAIGQSK